ncbi:substrate-binding domain-containing protein [Alphaproteobacteria bacterium]|nr:substrate-binding domain-containing protein [Alphaproteobacteria bacterium]
MKNIIKSVLLSAVAIFLIASPASAKKLKFAYVMHDLPEGIFWNTVYDGMKKACADLDSMDHLEVECEMVGTPYNVVNQVNNLRAVIGSGVDGIVSTIIDDDKMDGVFQEALDRGIPIISANTDDAKGSDGNPRLAYVGSNLYNAGYDLCVAAVALVPEGPIHALLGHNDVTQNFAIQRNAGHEDCLKDFAAANPDREVTWEVIEITMDGPTIQSRVGAYILSEPKTNIYLETGIWHLHVSQTLEEMGKQPGEIILAGYGAYSSLISRMKEGWVQLTNDQGAWLQGYLPIIQLYLIDMGFQPFDVQTDSALNGVITEEIAKDLDVDSPRIWKM